MASSPFVNPGQSAPNGNLHRLEVRYRHGAGTAQVRLSWVDQPPPGEVPVNAWRADYYTTRNLAGFMLSRTELAINNNYQGDSPDPAIGSDNFSARWTGDWDLPPGNYTFSATTDDGMRIYVDNVLMLNKWIDQPPTTYTFTRSFANAGRHRLRVEYYENAGGATAMFSWKAPPLILSQPQSQTVLAGSTVKFSVNVSGFPAPSCQWRFGSNPIAGATSTNLILTGVDLTNSGGYSVVVSNLAGTLASQTATLTVVPPAAIPVLGSPGFSTEGAFQFMFTGQTNWLYRIEATTDFLTWLPLADIPYTNGPFLFVDPQTTNFPRRFYRGALH
jgi:hypothetical protein